VQASPARMKKKGNGQGGTQVGFCIHHDPACLFSTKKRTKKRWKPKSDQPT